MECVHLQKSIAIHSYRNDDRRAGFSDQSFDPCGSIIATASVLKNVSALSRVRPGTTL